MSIWLEPVKPNVSSRWVDERDAQYLVIRTSLMSVVEVQNVDVTSMKFLNTVTTFHYPKLLYWVDERNSQANKLYWSVLLLQWWDFIALIRSNNNDHSSPSEKDFFYNVAFLRCQENLSLYKPYTISQTIFVCKRNCIFFLWEYILP